MVAIIVIAIIPVAIVLARRPHDPNLQDLGMVPPFQLVDDRNEPITQDVFRGHPTIVSFLFTRCDTICPVTTMKMAKIQEKTFDKGAQIKLVSISVDPKYDTPDRLAEYAQRYHADATRWRFITGTTARHIRNVPFRFTSWLRFQTSSESDSTGPPGATPALLTSTSMRP